MKLYYFSILIWEAFKNHCCAYPVKSQKVVMPDTADQFLAMNKKEDSNDLL